MEKLETSCFKHFLKGCNGYSASGGGDFISQDNVTLKNLFISSYRGYCYQTCAVKIEVRRAPLHLG